ncbi:related to FMP25 Found in Mitochondrial Proteome [Cephalotrichum gorgonifer]|uniref:Related to FMP25 Found in Mitochondrial Proteome n=1 Tax=Cephalotrichum gorgonifer TaxID=2041049 RepID=A0AAE8N2V7_9PEZI|nr:related to FMP25 Found in Mitochondrial Proteome [Cephalotrichum gorgonifer]
MQPLPRSSALMRRTLGRPSTLNASRSRFAQRRRVHSSGPGGPSPSANTPPPHESSEGARPPQGPKALKFLAVFGLSAGAAYYFYPGTAPSEEAKAEKPRKPKTTKAVPVVEKKPESGPAKSSQDSPGVYAWGSNAGKVIDPTSSETAIKAPRRIAFFDDQVLRDLKLRSNFGAAINEKGNLILWGDAVSSTDPNPVTTLEGKDLVKLAVSADRVIALSSKGTVYSVPVNRNDQLTGQKVTPEGSSWIPFWHSAGQPDAVNYRILTPGSLKSGEKVVDISSGLEHCLLLTSKGRVFSAAASTLGFPSKGQLGVTGLTWLTRPDGPYDQPHELTALSDRQTIQIATGDLHSAVLDKDGRIFVWGDNIYGQLGYAGAQGKQFVDKPIPLIVEKLYAKSGYDPRVTSVAAGGTSTFFTAEANSTRFPASEEDVPSHTFDVWACGGGLHGTLGTGKFSHASSRPLKVKSLSSAFEFDEAAGKLAPIRISRLSVGDDHVAAVMDAKTPASSPKTGEDVLVWGGNEHYQLGTGKRSNLHTPTFVAGLDSASRTPDEAVPGQDQRLQLAPRRTVRLDGGKGRKVSFEQRVECGGLVTAIYSAV